MSVLNASLVVPAAGSGTRFGGELPKQLLPLAGRAILLRTLDAFAGLVDEAVVATAPALIPRLAELLAAAPPALPVRLVAGGADRRASVHAGLLATAPGATAVLVHDAVRPLVPRGCIVACLAALAARPAAVVALPCAATVKEAAADGSVARTVPRERLWLAQTPQGLRRAEALAAFARAAAEGWTVTDDAEVMERAGYPVALVPGDPRNLKITTPDDLALAEALWAVGARSGAG